MRVLQRKTIIVLRKEYHMYQHQKRHLVSIGKTILPRSVSAYRFIKQGICMISLSSIFTLTKYGSHDDDLSSRHCSNSNIYRVACDVFLIWYTYTHRYIYIYIYIYTLWNITKDEPHKSLSYQHGFVSTILQHVLNCNVIHVKVLRPRQKSRHFPDEIFKCIFLSWMKMYKFR